MNIAASGEFWLPETPGKTVCGAFRADAGEKPEAQLARALVEDPRVATSPMGGTTYGIGGAPNSVEAFLPITIQGRLDSGDSVTLVNAGNRGGPGFPFEAPHYEAHYAILGDRNVSGLDQKFSGMRFRFGDPYWLGHLQAGDVSTVDDDGSTLSVEAADDGNWLLYKTATPATLARLEARIVMGCLTLAELALDQDFAARDTQVYINDGDAWLTVHGVGANTPPKEFEYATLLPRDELTLERFTTWIPLNDKLDGLARVVARPIEGFLQTQVLVVTSVLEGLHRRLPLAQSKFPTASNSAVDRVRQAARRAAKAKAADQENLPPDEVHKAVNDALGHFDDVDYLKRASDVVTTVRAVLPEIAESISADDLAKHIKDARIEMAHQTPLDHEREPLEVRYLRWMVVANATPWLLRGLLLLELGIEPGPLHLGHMGYSRFLYSVANVNQFVKELGWQLPPTTS
jgi:hypothetical protein